MYLLHYKSNLDSKWQKIEYKRINYIRKFLVTNTPAIWKVYNGIDTDKFGLMAHNNLEKYGLSRYIEKIEPKK